LTFDKKYRLEAERFTRLKQFSEYRSVGWRSPSNIALIKYWGKRHFQLPENPSLSFTLQESFTETTVQYTYKPKTGISVDFRLEGKPNPSFENRITGFMEHISKYLPFIRNLHLKIDSKNSFPHSSGIASSASSMSALVLCLLTIEQDLFESLKNEKAFFKKASFLSRLGSGSAARSVYGNYSVWGKSAFISNSSDEVAIPFNHKIHPEFMETGDAILITSTGSKKISSSAGHNLMKDHPYAAARYQQANNNLINLINALESGDEQLFVSVVENEALSLHALMMSSSAGYSLLNENTWEIIKKIRKFRDKKNTFAAINGLMTRQGEVLLS